MNNALRGKKAPTTESKWFMDWYYDEYWGNQSDSECIGYRYYIDITDLMADYILVSTSCRNPQIEVYTVTGEHPGDSLRTDELRRLFETESVG